MSSQLSTIKQTKDLLEKYGLSPKKSFGQNFLVRKEEVKNLINAGEIKKTDIVLEIGPGIGILTKELAKSARKVIAVEKDFQMAKILEEELSLLKISNVEIVRKDILDYLKEDGLKLKEYKAAGNIPFYLTAHLIRLLLESPNPPKNMAFILQKEVGQRIASLPPKMSLLSASVQFYASPRLCGYIKKSSFWPSPAVDAAIIKISPKPLDPNVNRDLFFKILKAGFSQPRKQIANNLSISLKADKIEINNWLLKNNIQPSQRAETLSIGDWINLTKTFND
ncbi:MAG: 16S rRNA (adenine(1518)-N(6)/adenine(1519)-N(6))-dimethyltransferase RsmA [Candidatus Pacebacteria bacterium]|nr:16S rRNA (adenine(1518)-N(6)/adenine(1519)-N(6))-dimethyltransferase RsmA [Candidatus Paceibacterota bacterium]